MGSSAEAGNDIVGKAKVMDGSKLVGIAVGIENGSVKEGRAVGRSKLKEGSTVGRLGLGSKDGRDKVGSPATLVKMPV